MQGTDEKMGFEGVDVPSQLMEMAAKGEAGNEEKVGEDGRELEGYVAQGCCVLCSGGRAIEIYCGVQN